MLNLKEIKDELVIKVNKDLKDCREFVERIHYTKSYGAGGRLYFSLWFKDKMMGVGIWREPNGRLTYKSFNLENNKPILDLTRFCLEDEMPQNTASWFLSRQIKYIRDNCLDIHFLITYADYNQEHKGIIYRATNWIPFGVGGDGRKVYDILDDGTLKLTSSRWLNKKDKDKIKKIKIKKKFRYTLPLRMKRKKFRKTYKDTLTKFDKLWVKLDKDFKVETSFKLKEVKNKKLCLTCKEFVCLCKLNL